MDRYTCVQAIVLAHINRGLALDHGTYLFLGLMDLIDTYMSYLLCNYTVYELWKYISILD